MALYFAKNKFKSSERAVKFTRLQHFSVVKNLLLQNFRIVCSPITELDFQFLKQLKLRKTKIQDKN